MSKREFNFERMDIDVDKWVDKLHDYVTSDEYKEVEEKLQNMRGTKDE